jgi:integrase
VNLEEYPEQDGMKVWLSEEEVGLLLDHYDDTEKRVALALGARCGLRSDETVRVAPEDVVDTDAGTMLRVESAKTGKYRETPIPSDLATTIRTVADVRDEPDDDPVVNS